MDLEECLDRRVRTIVLADRDDVQLATLGLRQPVERRKLLHARRAPARPQVHQRRLTGERLEAGRLAVGGVEALARRRGAPCVRSTPFAGSACDVASLSLAWGWEGFWHEASASNAQPIRSNRMAPAASLGGGKRLVGSHDTDAAPRPCRHAALGSCGRQVDLKPAPGQPLPVKPLMARTTPTPRSF